MLINTDVNLLKQFLNRLQQVWHVLLPAPCLWCSLPVQRYNRQLCCVCELALPKLPYQLCHYNLLHLPQVARGLTKHRFDALLSVSYYQQPFQHWLQRWKFAQDLAAGDLLQQQFARLLRQYQQDKGVLPDAIVYVPMHPSKQRKRGFNPALMLAERAAEQLGVTLLPVLQRPQRQSAQVGLNRKQRQRNLRHAFCLQANAVLPARIALVDDVITTGATANELCRLLRRHGAKHISLWTVAVTLFD
jgi:ComF family protein